MAKISRTFWCAMAVSVLLVFGGTATALAAAAHSGACNNCHRSAANPRLMANLCVTCHASGGTASDKFSVAMASNAMGSHPTPSTAAGSQTSHFWGGSSSTMPAAGSSAPAATFYNSRNQISTGLVTCSICHDPHGTAGTNLVRATEAGDLICQQCHATFFVDNASALMTHPVGATVVLTADPLKFNPTVVNSGSGNVQMVNGYVSCTSCHGTHFTDSSSATADGVANSASLVAGDGKLLRTDGAKATGSSLEDTANKRSAVCTACHPYKTHGNATEPVGCLVCHSAHVYNSAGAPNYYVLRNSMTTTTFGTKTNITYTALGTPATTWADGSAGTANGVCEKCHGNLTTMAGSTRLHAEGENCASCHLHNKAGAVRSFEASGCDGCHGYPPASNSPVIGYAVNGAKNYSTSGVYKAEASTPHASHSVAATSGYSFACTFCHNANFNTTHDQGTFQNVFDATGTFQTAAKPAGATLNPAYTPTGVGTCNNVGCHSNGGKRTGDSTSSFKYVSVTWTGTINTISSCNACHGNDATTMAAAQKDNSVSHIKHLNAGYSCALCHSTTAASSTALAANAAGTTHVNGLNDISFSGVAAGGIYSPATGTCSVSCHGASTPDWDIAATGACGACHQYASAGVATGTGPALSAAHNSHVYTAGGQTLACTVCHTNNGTGADHVNGSVSFVANYQTAVCNPCHGSSNGVTTGDDRQPVWTNTASVDCQTCHIGVLSVISSKTAPNKSLALTAGHNKATDTYTGSGNSAAAKTCETCHTTAVTGHLDGITGDDTRLIGGFTCDSCHGSAGTATKKNIVTHQASNCNACHDPHGSTNIYMVNTTNAAFSGTVAFTATFGTNSYDEVDAVNGDDICATCHTAANQTNQHNNKTNTGVAHNEGIDCFTSCHKTHTEPTGAFAVGSGSSCNGCHDNPPATGAHAEHSLVQTHDTAEDRTDCAVCHTGANLYTYDPAADRAAGRNHGNTTGKITILTTAVGYNSTDKSCATACHNSSAADGAWTDANGLNCNACHYYAAAPSIAGNVQNGKAEPVSTASHNKHFGKAITCAGCHTVDNGGASLAGPLTHVKTDLTVGNSDLVKIQSRATALQDEADVVRTSMTFTDATNTCAGGIALGCHATGTPVWGATIDTATQCTACHTDTTTSTVNPTSGLHGVTPSISGIKHDATVSGGCAACHVNVAALSTHANGFFTGNGFVSGDKTSMGLGTMYSATADDTGTCATTACHLSKSDDWAHKWMTPANYTSATLSCTGCHGDFTTATMNSGVIHRNTTDAPNIATIHGGAGTYKCADCHSLGLTGYTFTFGTADWAPLNAGNLHGNGVVNLNNSNITYNDVTGYCTNCHTQGAPDNKHNFVDTTQTLAYFAGPSVVVSCSTCHGGGTVVGANKNYWPDGVNTFGDNATADNTGAHLKHITALANNVMGQTVTQLLTDNVGVGPAPWATSSADAKQKELCSYCHTNPGTDGDHASATQAEVNSMYIYKAVGGKTADTATYTTTNATCSTVDCHNNKTTTTSPTNFSWYGGATSTCVLCHLDVAADTTHTSHMVTGTYGRTIACTDCHAAGTSTTTAPTYANGHINGQFFDVGGTVITTAQYTGETYPTTKGTCGTNTCHNDGTGTGAPTNSGAGSYTWGTALTNCTACHNNPNTTGTGGVHHANHMAKTAYVASTCLDCHPAATATSHLNGLVQATGTKQTAYSAGTCTNSCHTLTGGSLWTNTTALACLDCHAGTYIGGGANLQTSGLHTGTLTVSGNTHDDSFNNGNAGTANCTTCHTATPSTAHINGTFDTSSPIISFNANVGFVDGTTPTCAPTGTGYVTCHDDSGVWKRKWSITAKNTNGTECANCHGDFTNGFVTGISLRHQTSTSGDANGAILANHGGSSNPCYTCHAYQSGSTTYYNYATQHRNGSIELNNGMGFADNGATVGCAGCHVSTGGTADGGFEFADTTARWTRNLIAGPAADCNGCHTSNGMTHTGTNESATVHTNHSGYTLLGATACTDCHTNNGTGTDHNNGTVNFGNKLASTINYAKAANYGGTCATASNGCHDSDTGEWFSGSLGADSCADCHATATASMGTLAGRAYPPTSAQHTVHINNNVKVPNDCTDCHGTNAATGAHVTHKNGAIDDTVTYVSANQTCTNTCHLADTTGDWTAGGTLVCADCHNAAGKSLTQGAWPPVSNKHPQHVGTAANAAYGDTVAHNTVTAYEFGCGQCHGTTATNHVNGSTDITVTNWTLASKTCGQNSCHQNGAGAAPAQIVDWDATPGYTGNDSCAICHGNSPTTAAHSVHTVGIHYQDIYTGTTGRMTAGNTTSSSHGNSATSTTINCNLCHSNTVSMSRNMYGSACVSCHGTDTANATNIMDVSNRTTHVNGAVNVAFANVNVKSKAQIRNTITTVPQLNNNWTRTGGYKVAGAYDAAKISLSSGSFSSNSCSNISCHNGKAISWVAPSNDCTKCHTALP